MTISNEVLNELLIRVEVADDLLGDQDLMRELKIRFLNFASIVLAPGAAGRDGGLNRVEGGHG